MYLVISFLVLFPIFAGAEPLTSEQVARLNKTWEAQSKTKHLNLSQGVELLAKKNWDVIQFTKVFSPKVVGKQTTAVPEWTDIEIKLGKNIQHVELKESCAVFLKTMEKSAKFQSVGEGMYLVRHNDYFAFHGKKNYFNALQKNCEMAEREKSFECPEATQIVQDLVAKVGPWITIETENIGAGGCGASTHSKEFETFDLDTGKKVEITDHFTGDSIVKSAIPEIEEFESSGKGDDKGDPASHATMVEELKNHWEFDGFAVASVKETKGKYWVAWALKEKYCGSCLNEFWLLNLEVVPTAATLKMLRALKPEKEMPFGDIENGKGP